MSMTGYISKLQEYELHALQLVVIYHHIPNHSHLQCFLISFDSDLEQLNIFNDHVPVKQQSSNQVNHSCDNSDSSILQTCRHKCTTEESIYPKQTNKKHAYLSFFLFRSSFKYASNQRDRRAVWSLGAKSGPYF